MLTSKQIRQKYLEFFKSKNHKIIPSASLIPENDSSTLFIGSGMQPLIPYLLGEKHPEGNRLTNSQKSFRPKDIEDVGDSRHSTVFEMLGNWSLGDYFKKEQLNWIYNFLIEDLKLDPQRLYASVYKGDKSINILKDEEAVEILKDIFKKYGIEAKDIENVEEKGMQGGRIFYYGDNNWWSRSGAPANMPVGEPGGPDSEIFYDLGADLIRHENSPWKDKECHPNCDCGRFVEIGNSVFMEYVRTKNGFEKLPQKNVDYGGGLERLVMVVQGKNNIFATDLYENVNKKIKEMSGGKEYKDNIKPYEVIEDHLKAATFIMGDDKGIPPSNIDQGYIVRRLIRRAIRYGKQLGIKTNSPFLKGGRGDFCNSPLACPADAGGRGIEGEVNVWTPEIAKIVIADYKEAYPELERNKDFILKNMAEEELKFSKTLERGLKQFEKIIQNKQCVLGDKIVCKDVFDLYQTYGFPFEMTAELATEKGLTIDENEFKIELAKHQDQSRTASAGKFKGGLADASEETKKLHTAAHLLLAALRQVLGDHVFQKGSNITAERLRFDFSHPAKMTDEEKKKVEDLVNKAIADNLPICCDEMDLEEAKKKNAMGVFESKYSQIVKVYSVGDGECLFSKEICGGPHVANTSELGRFKIQKEESSSAGVRRIKAVLE